MKIEKLEIVAAMMLLGLLAFLAAPAAGQEQTTSSQPLHPQIQAPSTGASSMAGTTWLEDFEPPTLEGWELPAGARLVQGRSGGMLAPDCPAHGIWVAVDVSELVLDFDFLQGTGTASVLLRQAEETQGSHYRLVLAEGVEAGILRLSGGQEQGIAGGTVALQSDTWYRVSISLVGGSLQVSVDGTPVLDVVDPQPLGPGNVELGCIQGSGFAFDNVSITSPELPTAQPTAPAIPINIPAVR